MSDSSSEKGPKKSVQQVIKTLRTKFIEDDQTMRITSPQKSKKRKNVLSSISDKNETRFTKEKHLGQGGMKDIKLVQDENMKRVVAKATIRPDKMNQKNIEMFVREARLMAALEHPNIVPIYDIGKNEKGEPYFIMKHLDGLTLQEVLFAIANEDEETITVFTNKKLLEIFKEICKTISYAHRKKTLHLDIKPDNIHITSEGKVYVIDWGLSKITEKKNAEEFEELFDTNLDETMSGDIKGTPGYLAPEQIIKKNNHFTPATDIYGLGGLLYSILCLEAPISESSIDDDLRKTLYGEITKPSLRRPDLKIDKSLEQIAMKALERLPRDRYQNVDDLIVDIDACLHKKKSVPKHLVIGVSITLAFCIVFCLVQVLNHMDGMDFFDSTSSNIEVPQHTHVSSPLGLWKLDETLGVFVSDSSNNGNKGILRGHRTFKSHGKKGVIGRALLFDGKDDYIDFGDKPDFRNLVDTTDFSIFLWMKMTKHNSTSGSGGWRQRIAHKRNPDGWIFLIGDNRELSFATINSKTSDASFSSHANAIPLNKWIHVGFVYSKDSQSCKLYINGQETAYTKQSAGIDSTHRDAGKAMVFGKNHFLHADQHFNGLMDEIRIYKNALTEQEIRDLYKQKP